MSGHIVRSPSISTEEETNDLMNYNSESSVFTFGSHKVESMFNQMLYMVEEGYMEN